MTETFQPRKTFRHRPRVVPAPAAVPSPPTGVAVTGVLRLGSGRFQWTFSSSFDADGWESWAAGQLAGLKVGGQNPTGIEEAKGAAGQLTLLYGPFGNNAFAVTAAPAVLAFDVGLPLLVPQSGTVVG